MVDLKQYQQLNYFETLKNTSVDKHDGNSLEYMIECELKVIDFDKVKEKYILNLGVTEAPKSNDALFQEKSGHIVFVEFKNGFMDRPKQFGIRKKIYDSVLIFSDITSLGISYLRNNAKYILVYNQQVNAENQDIPDEVKAKQVQESKAFDQLAKGIRNLGKEEYVLFGVNIFKNYCFESVHTYTEQEFQKYISVNL